MRVTVERERVAFDGSGFAGIKSFTFLGHIARVGELWNRSLALYSGMETLKV